jgi:hypothetical protein
VTGHDDGALVGVPAPRDSASECAAFGHRLVERFDDHGRPAMRCRCGGNSKLLLGREAPEE